MLRAWFIPLNVIHLILQALDCLTTWYALSHQFAYEGNPCAAWILDHGGFAALIFYKFVVVAIVYFGSRYLIFDDAGVTVKEKQQLISVFFIILIAGYLAVVASNTWLIIVFWSHRLSEFALPLLPQIQHIDH